MLRLTDFVMDGLCAQTDPEIFFNDKPDRWNGHVPKDVCAVCPVLALCRKWAIPQPQLHGVWGGTTQEERIEIRAGRAS